MRFEAVGSDAAEGSGIEVRSADHSTQSVEKVFHLHFSVIRMGSQTPSRFED